MIVRAGFFPSEPKRVYGSGLATLSTQLSTEFLRLRRDAQRTFEPACETRPGMNFAPPSSADPPLDVRRPFNGGLAQSTTSVPSIARRVARRFS